MLDPTKIYVVGGAVRDVLLSREVKDLDYVVVGSTPAEMLANGFTQVGADFPVFLHPETREEYALARTERKTGAGYHGFETSFDPTVSLRDDLLRRDITINAMAVKLSDWEAFKAWEEGDKDSAARGFHTVNPYLIDYFGGLEHLVYSRLHPVSEAFAEDPLRVLRAARFQARYSLTQTPEASNMIKKIVDSGELRTLTPERVWVETVKAVSGNRPLTYFMFFDFNRCRHILYPEVEVTQWLDASFKIALQEGDFDVLDRMTMLTVTMKDEKTIRNFFARMKAPNEFTELAVITYFLKVLTTHTLHPDLSEEYITDTLQHVGAFRNTDVVMKALKVLSRLVEQFGTQDNARFLMDIVPRMAKIGFDDLTQEQKATLKGKAIGDAIRAVRVSIVKNALFLEELKGG